MTMTSSRIFTCWLHSSHL